ncbi:hypothetical protein QT341_26200 [Escherichia coli]|nr:hypothetical protein [Escherichia coli]
MPQHQVHYQKSWRQLQYPSEILLTSVIKIFPVALNMAIAAGKEGRVELKDMAEALPGQLGIAQKTGMWGLDGFQKILTANEAAGITAGNGKEAANNTLNFLDKINQ